MSAARSPRAAVVLASLISFAAGACATAVATPESAARADAEEGAVISRGDDGPAPSVIPAERAPRAVAPSGKAAVRLLAQGSNAFLGELSMDAGAAVPEHADTTEEYIHVLEGGGTMTIDGQVHTISAGTTVFMPAGATVSYQNGDAPLRALQVFAGPAPASKYDTWTRDG